MLESSVDHAVPLSNVKRLFRARFHMELSETSLGHAKLSDLLHDPKLADICSVKLLDQGYFVVPQSTASARRTGLSDAHDAKDTKGVSSWTRARTQTLEALPLSSIHYLDMVQNTFIHAPVYTSVPGQRRSRSVPTNLGSLVCHGEAQIGLEETIGDIAQLSEALSGSVEEQGVLTSQSTARAEVREADSAVTLGFGSELLHDVQLYAAPSGSFTLPLCSSVELRLTDYV